MFKIRIFFHKIMSFSNFPSFTGWLSRLSCLPFLAAFLVSFTSNLQAADADSDNVEALSTTASTL
jgi:ABC-type multidrug transport system permease subunit